MEECGRGAAVEQLTARGMEYQSPQWGAIGGEMDFHCEWRVSIPAMGGNRETFYAMTDNKRINPRDGGQ